MQIEVGGHSNWTVWFVGILVAGCLALSLFANYERQALKVTQLENQVKDAEEKKLKAEDDLAKAKSANDNLTQQIATLEKLQSSQRVIADDHIVKVKQLTTKSTAVIRKLPRPVAKIKEPPVSAEYEAHSMARIDALWEQYCTQPTDASLCPKEGAAS